MEELLAGYWSKMTRELLEKIDEIRRTDMN